MTSFGGWKTVVDSDDEFVFEHPDGLVRIVGVVVPEGHWSVDVYEYDDSSNSFVCTNSVGGAYLSRMSALNRAVSVRNSVEEK